MVKDERCCSSTHTLVKGTNLFFDIALKNKVPYGSDSFSKSALLQVKIYQSNVPQTRETQPEKKDSGGGGGGGG